MSELELVGPCKDRYPCYWEKCERCGRYHSHLQYHARLDERNRIVGLISDNILLASLSYGGEVLIGWVMPDEFWQALKGESDATK